MDIDRRGLLQGGLGFAAALALWPQVQAKAASPLLVRVCDQVIPRTDTPGAVDVGVPAFVELGLAHGLEGAPPGNDYLGWLEGELTRHGDDLAALDKEAFSSREPSPWKTIKALILVGYYTSEAGASQELRYELVPGRWDADIPLSPSDRAWSSDWTAVDFG